MANRTVLIPSETDPFVVKINNDVFEYPAGSEQSVPDEVADVIDNYWRNQPKDPGVAYDPKYTKKEVDESVDKTKSIIANPALAGTEDTLTGLQIGDTKYKAGGGDPLYLHTMHWKKNNVKYTVQFLSTKSSKITHDAFRQWLSGKSYTGSNFMTCIGSITPTVQPGTNSTKLYARNVQGVSATGSNINIQVSGYDYTFTTNGSTVTITAGTLSTSTIEGLKSTESAVDFPTPVVTI